MGHNGRNLENMCKIGGNVGCQMSRIVQLVRAPPQTPSCGWLHPHLGLHPWTPLWAWLPDPHIHRPIKFWIRPCLKQHSMITEVCAMCAAGDPSRCQCPCHLPERLQSVHNAWIRSFSLKNTWRGRLRAAPWSATHQLRRVYLWYLGYLVPPPRTAYTAAVHFCRTRPATNAESSNRITYLFNGVTAWWSVPVARRIWRV